MRNSEVDQEAAETGLPGRQPEEGGRQYHGFCICSFALLRVGVSRVLAGRLRKSIEKEERSLTTLLLRSITTEYLIPIPEFGTDFERDCTRAGSLYCKSIKGYTTIFVHGVSSFLPCA